MSRNCNIDQLDSNETLKIKLASQPHALTSNRLSNIKLPKHKTSKESEKTILKQVANFKPKRKSLEINKSMEQVTKVSPKQPERQELQVNNLALNNSNEKKCAILAVTSHSQEKSFKPNTTCGTKSKVLTKVTEVANNRHENKENSSLYDQDAPNTLGTLANTDVSSKHSLGFMYGYRNASLHCLLHLATKLLSSCKSDNEQEKQTVGKSRDLWVLSLDNCQKRRRQNNQWLSERNKQNGVEVEDKNVNLSTKSSQQIPVDTLPSLSTCSTSFLLNEESMRAFFSMEHAVTPIKTPWNSYADRMDS
uniref:Uncharacterized protein n=1 Tax=Ciona savignyi TaxID=51511 RepID=H2YZF6_CIOSA